MKRILLRTTLALFGVLITTLALAADKPQGTIVRPDGMRLNTAADQPLSFYGATPVEQPSGAAQTALTDSTGGSVADATLASTAGISTLSIPIQLASMTTSAADLVTNLTLGYKFKILAASFTTTTIGVGSSASQVINLEINSTNVTGGVVTITEASTDTLGEASAGTSITAANTGSASDTISIEVAASGTVFSAGAGVLFIRVQNMDVQDNAAKTAELVNALRSALVNLGAIAGS